MKGTLFSTIMNFPLWVCSQSGPGGVGNKTSNELWLTVEEHCYADTGVTFCTNRAEIQQWNHRSGNGHHAVQLNTSFQPNVHSNCLYNLSTHFFNGSSDRILTTGLTTIARLTYFAVYLLNGSAEMNQNVLGRRYPRNVFTTLFGNKSVGLWVQGRGLQSYDTFHNFPSKQSIVK